MKFAYLVQNQEIEVYCFYINAFENISASFPKPQCPTFNGFMEAC